MNYLHPAVHLTTLIPSASDDATSLISSLWSWDPLKRPTAAEVLQHPFFQNCFYAPPSLRARATGNTTPPPLGSKGYSEQKSARKSCGPGTLPTSKSTS